VNLFVIVIGFLELILSILVSVFTIFITFKVFHVITKKIDDISELKKNNYSVALYNSAILFSVAWVVRSSVNSAISALTVVFTNPDSNHIAILKVMGIMSVQIILSAVIAFFGVYIAISIFMFLTKQIDEFTEIKNNNLAVAIIIATIVIIVALFIEPSVKTIVDGLVPYPAILSNPV